VPERLKDLWRQRVRWTKADIQIAKRYRNMYFNRKRGGAGMFSLPVMTYWQFHACALIILIALQIILGYNQYFLSNGTVFSGEVAKFVFGWFSLFGIINLGVNTALGVWPLTLLSGLSIFAIAASYVLYIYSIFWLGEKPGIRDIVVFFFMFPYWLITMAAQVVGLAEWFRGEGRNWWEK
jgi:cellulose synthase/poly-beta-1,6-N-acetylglucosamine synthase-like glycosyltransferase